MPESDGKSTLEPREKMAGLDVIAAFCLFFFGAGVTYFSWTMKVFNRSRIVSPGLFPFILGIVFMFLALLMGLFALRRNGWKAAGHMLGAANLKACLSSQRFHRGGIVMLAIFSYALLFGRVHFVFATALYLLFNFLYLKALKPPAAVFVSLAAAAAVFGVFTFVFGIPIP